MDRSGFAPVFQVLVCLHAALAYVEPPTNVTFHCHNLHNVLKWSYTESTPGVRFKLWIGTIEPKSGYPTELFFEPPTKEANLSFLSDPINAYYLELTAVIGKEESAVATEDLTFSYFKDSPAKRICSVDLPSVNVTVFPNESIKFHFTHPWMLYHDRLSGRSNLKHRKRASNNYPEIEGLLPEFSYTVTIVQPLCTQSHRPFTCHHPFTCDEDVCGGELPVDSSQSSHCLTIVGEMERMKVKGTHEFCAVPYPNPKPNIKIYLPVVLTCMVVLAIVFVAHMVYKKRTSPSQSDVSYLNTSVSHPSVLKLKREDMDDVKVEPTSPTPLLPEEHDDFTHLTPETTDDRVDDEGVFDDSEEPGYKVINMDGDESENSNQTSGYERRPDIRQPKA